MLEVATKALRCVLAWCTSSAGVPVVVVVTDLAGRRRKQTSGERTRRPMLWGFRTHERDYESLDDELEAGCNDDQQWGTTSLTSGRLFISRVVWHVLMAACSQKRLKCNLLDGVVVL